MFKKYAELVLKTGINLQPGDRVVVKAEPIHWNLLLEIEAKAYEMGARYVEFDVTHPKSAVNQSKLMRDEYLDYLPSYMKTRTEDRVSEGWSALWIDGQEDPSLSKQIDQARYSKAVKAQRTVGKPWAMTRMSGITAWNICCAATDGWARQLGLPDKDALWKILVPILKLDQPDPHAAWFQHAELLAARAKALNAMKPKFLHYTGPGTDLKIHMIQGARWLAAVPGVGWQRQMFCNLPTEEIYTAPDYRLTSGRVNVTRPVNVLGDQVEGAWFVFEDGVVVEHGAAYGKHLLDEYFKIDPKARFLGEAALVDSSSPIFKSGRVFNNILLDENASCHIALGSGIPTSVPNYEGKSEDELDSLGCNKSLLHTDFMIGSDEVSINAHCEDGSVRPVLVKGAFAI